MKTIQNEILNIIKGELKNASVTEKSITGSFLIGEDDLKLFPGGIYGFFSQLTDKEALDFFSEAKKRSTTKLTTIDEFKPISKNIYPIYWGKDQFIGQRPYAHIKNYKGNGIIRLGTYKTLKYKRIIITCMVVSDNGKFEEFLQKKYQPLLLTKKTKYEGK